MLPAKTWVALAARGENSYEMEWLNTMTNKFTSKEEDGWKEGAPAPANGHKACVYFDNDPENPGLQDGECYRDNVPVLCYIPYEY